MRAWPRAADSRRTGCRLCDTLFPWCRYTLGRRRYHRSGSWPVPARGRIEPRKPSTSSFTDWRTDRAIALPVKNRTPNHIPDQNTRIPVRMQSQWRGRAAKRKRVLHHSQKVDTFPLLRIQVRPAHSRSRRQSHRAKIPGTWRPCRAHTDCGAGRRRTRFPPRLQGSPPG